MSELQAIATKPCRHCGEDIKPSALVCRFCNRDQAEAEDERILYDGPGNKPVRKFMRDIVLTILTLGVASPLLLMDYLTYRSRRYRVTNQQIVLESGIFSKRVDLLDLFRIQDMQYRSEWGIGTIVLTTSDKTTPSLALPIPNAKAVFDQLRGAVAAARKRANVSVQERV